MAKVLRTTESLCSCCKSIKSNGQFYPSIGIQYQDRVPICKECCKNKYDKYSSILGNDGGAWVLLSELGIPYIADKWKTAQTYSKSNTTKGKGTTDPISLYIRSIKDSGIIYQGFWESDTMYNEILGQNKNKVTNPILIEDMTDLASLQLKWGKYDDIDAYNFLENTLNDYTEDLFEIDSNLLTRYKDLCILEYYKRKAQEGGDISEIAKAQDRIDKQLKLLKLDEFQTNTQTEDEKHIEYICWEIENTRPAECEDLEKYKDFSGFGKTMEHIMRCCKNLVSGSKDYPDLPKDD